MPPAIQPGADSQPSDDSPRPGRRVFMDKEWAKLAKRLGLTERELGVVQLVFDGASERAIAVELGLSAHTVHTYMARIYRKLGVHRREHLLVRVFSESRFLHPDR